MTKMTKLWGALALIFAAGMTWGAQMYSNPLADGSAKIPSGNYGTITVSAPYAATDYTQTTQIGNSNSDIKSVLGGDLYVNTHTVSGWFKVDALPTSGNKTIYAAISYENIYGGYKLAVDNTGKLIVGRINGNDYTLYQNTGNATEFVTMANTALVANQWYYITVAVSHGTSNNTTTPTVYINGESCAVSGTPTTFTGGLNGNTFKHFDIGAGISAAGLYADTEALSDAAVIKALATNSEYVKPYVVAKIGEDKYATLAQAISAAREGTEIIVLKNVDEAVELSKNIILSVEDGNSVTLSGVISGSGKLTKKGTGTLTLSATNTFTGGTEILAGTLTMGSVAALGPLGANVTIGKVGDSTRGTLNVCAGAMGLNVTLSGGTIANVSGTDIATSVDQIRSLTLTEDSTIHCQNRLSVIGNTANATLALNGHKLTKTGSSSMYLKGVTPDTGTIRIEDGFIDPFNNGSYANLTVEIAGGRLDSDNSPLTVKNVILSSGSINLHDSKQLVINENLTTTGGTIASQVKFADNATITPTSPASLTSTFAFAGAINVVADLDATVTTGLGTLANDPTSVKLRNEAGDYMLLAEDNKIVVTIPTDLVEENTVDVSNSKSISYLSIGNHGVQKFSGTGGVQISKFFMKDGSTLVVDPVKNPIYVTGVVPTFESGAKIKLADAYVGKKGTAMLMAWNGSTEPTLPAGLFDTVTYPNAELSFKHYTSTFQLSAEAGVAKTITALMVNLDTTVAKKPIKVMPLGDSITEGTNQNGFGNPNYRMFLLEKLAIEGYDVSSVGFRKVKTMNAAGVAMPEEWCWHNGVSGQRLVSSDSRAGWRDALEATLDASEIPDVITFKIGTNDAETDVTKLIAEWAEVMKRIIAARPTTKIIVGSIMPKEGDGDTWVRSWNEKLSTAITNNTYDFPENQVFFADLYTNCPRLSDGVSNFNDSLHPNWIGHEKNAETWKTAIVDALADDKVIEGNPTFEPNLKTGAMANVGDAYRNGFVHLRTYKPSNSVSQGTSSITYAYEASIPADTQYDQIAYYMELKNSRSGNVRWVWVDMDNWSENKTISEFGIPYNYAKLCTASNIHIDTNDGGIQKVAPETSGVEGWIQFGCGSYQNGTSASGAPTAFFTSDWNDNVVDTGSYGAMNIYRKAPAGVTGGLTPHAAQTLMAYSRFRTGDQEIGIGNCAIHGTPLVANNRATTVNYFDTYQYERLDLASYDLASIEIWGKTNAIDPIATCDDIEYITITDALDAAEAAATAESPKTVMLLRSVSEAIEIPANVIVATTATGDKKLTGAITGEGTVIFDGYVPTDAQRTKFASAEWSGTLWLKNIDRTVVRDGTSNFWAVPQNYGNASSAVRFTNVLGYLAGGTYSYVIDLVDEDGVALTVDAGGNTAVTTIKLAGSGTLKNTYNHGHRFNIDVETYGFTGSLNAGTSGGKKFIVGTSTSANQGQIVVDAGKTATISESATWTASAGVLVNGTVKGSGNVAGNITFADTAAIDLTDGALTVSGSATFGAAINLVVANGATLGHGSVVIKAASFSGNPTVSINSVESEYKLMRNAAGAIVLYDSQYVAEIDGVGYTTIEEAINTATVDQVVKILIPIGDGRDLDIPANKTIDIGSNSVDGAIIIGLGSKVIVSGNRTTNGIIGPGMLVVSSGTITANNQASGYAVDGATVQLDGGTFALNGAVGGAFNTDASDPTIRNAKFVFGDGSLSCNNWVNMVGTIEFYSDETSEKNAFGNNKSFRGTPDIIKSGSGTVKFNINTTGTIKSLTVNDGVFKLNQASSVTTDTIFLSGKKHHEVVASDDNLTYSLELKLKLKATLAEGTAYTWNGLSWKNEDGTDATWVDGAIAMLTVCSDQQLAIPTTQGFAADEIILQGEGNITLTYDTASPAVPVDATEFAGSLKVISDQALTIEAGEKTITFSCSTEVAPTITCGTLVKEGAGKLVLGEYRPNVIDVQAGQIELTLTDDERVAGKISFTAPAGLTTEQAAAYASKVIVKTHTGKTMTEKTTSLVNGKLVISFTPPKVASYNGVEYATLEAAMNAAKDHQTTEYKVVKLLDSVYHTVDIPEGLVIKTSDQCRFKGAVTGQGEILFEGYVPSGEELIASLRKGATWQGSVVLKDIGPAQIEDQHKVIRFNTLGNTHSRIVIDNVTSTMYAGTVDYPNTSVGEIYIADGGWTTTNLQFSNNSPSYTCKLTGTGAITVNQKGNGTIQFIGDASEFRGSLVMGDETGKGLILKKEHCTHTAGAKQIVVDVGKTMMIPAGKVWEARGGITIEGIVTGGGRLVGNVTFEPGSELEVTEMDTILHCEDVVIFKEHMNVHIPEVAEDVKVLEAEEMNLMNGAGEVVDSISFEVHSEKDDEKVHHDHYIFHFSDGFVRVTEDIDATLAGIGYNTLVEALAAANAHGLDPQEIIIHNQSLTDADIPLEYRDAYQIGTGEDGKKKIVQNSNVVVVFLDANGGLFPATEKTGAVSNKARYVQKGSLYPIDGSDTYPNPTRTNFTLEGWHIYGSDGEAHHIGPTETVSENCHLVANWTGADEYKITHIGTGAIPAEQLSRPPISINHDWITAHVPAALTTTIERETWLNGVGDNGLNRWQSYVLGLNPNDAKSLPYIKVNRNADDQRGVRGELCVDVGGVTPAEGHTIRPYYHVEYATGIDENGKLVNKTANTEQKASGSLTLPAPQPATEERPADHHVRYYSLGVSYQFLRSLEEAAAAAQLYATHDENQPCREHEDHNYIPTNLTNGDFEEDPNAGRSWMDADAARRKDTCPYLKGEWNTTEVYSNVENQPFFEWKDAAFVKSTYNANLKPPAFGTYVCEMNAQNAGMLYQDLATHGGDVIEWRLRHAVRTNGPDDQSIRVEIGKPMTNDDGTIVPATGVGANIDPKIVKDGSLAIFEAYSNRTYTVKNGLNDTSTIAYGNNSTTRNLYLDKTKHQFRWYTAGGVYVVPQGQELTRFGFISATKDENKRSLGNLLDNIEFFTLLGNLVAKEAEDGSVVLTGYWGDTDPMNKLVVEVEVDGKTTKHAVDMMNARKDGNGYFHVSIPPELIGSAGSLTAYHANYPDTKVTVDLLPVSATAFNTPVFGMLRVDSNQPETIINVPWMEASDDAQAIQICDLVRASNLTEGDELLYRSVPEVGSQESFLYKRWMLREQDGVKYWEPYTTVGRSETGETEIGRAAEDAASRIGRGGALFVIRPTKYDEPIYLHGRLAMADGATAGNTSVTVTKGALKQPAYTLLAPSGVEKVNLNAPGVMSGTPPGENDRIQLKQGELLYYRNEKWGKYGAFNWNTWTYEFDTSEAATTIPHGQGCWYVSEGGAPTFNW